MQKIKEILKKEKYFSIIIILIATIFVCIPLMNKNIDMTYDDGIQHICRLIGTFQSLEKGETGQILSNFCNGFGYSWNLFYSPLTAYLPLIFKLIGCNFAVCIKLFMALSVFLSGYFMYLFTKKVSKNNYIAILSAILYIFVPYRFTDMYVRNAFAEHTSFVFLPLIFLGLYNLFNEENKKKTYILCIGSIGLVLTHTVVTMYAAIFSAIYVLINIKKLKDKKILKLILINILLILVITSFFWATLLELKNATQYEVFREGRMERTDVLVAYKLDFYRLFFTLSNDHMIYEVGLVTLIGLIVTPFVIKKIKDKKYYKLYLFMLISGIVCCIMTLKIFPFESMPSILKMIQFSFRLLEFSGFFFSFVAAINIVTLCKKFETKEILIILLVMAILYIPYKNQLRTLENYNEEALLEPIPVTEDTGRVHAGCASFEYLPTKAFENLDYIKSREDKALVLNGTAEISNQEKNGTNMKFDIKYVLEETEVELPYIYYLGYEVILENNDKNIKLETFETDNGFVGIKVPITEEGRITIKYEGTWIMKISAFASVVGLCCLMGVALGTFPNRKQDRKLK